MNVLFVTTNSAYFGSPFGGAESSMKLLASELAVAGDRVVYVTMLQDNSMGIKLRRCVVAGVRVYAIGFADRLSSFRPTLAAQVLLLGVLALFLIRKHRIELVYSSYELNQLKLLLWLKRLGSGFRLVMRMAGMHWYEACRRKPALVRAYENVFNQVDSVNYIHGGLEKMVREKLELLGMKVSFRHAFSGDIGTAVPVGRDRAYCPLNDGVFSLMMATRFSDYQKRQDILVRAIAKIPETIPVELCLFGSGVRRGEIAALIEDLGVSDRVRIEPFTDQQQLWQRMQRTGSLCHACEYEGLGKIIIESMAMGLPVLASDVAPLNEYIEDGENGFLVGNCPELWAERIVELYHNPEKLAVVSERSMQFIAQNYDPKRNVRLYQQAFNEVTGSNACTV